MRPVPDLADLPVLRTHALPVGDGHVLNVQEFGHPQGQPLALLHGGPGSGASPVLRRGFDSAAWRVICIDQRGAGGSRPRGATEANTTEHLLADLRQVRQALGVERWVIAGGSWGATLAVAYAAFEPQAAAGLLLRASFLARRADIDGFFQRPAERALQPAWERLVERVGTPLLPTLHRMLTAGTHAQQEAAAQAWRDWELALGEGVNAAPALAGEALARQVDRLRVQSHYLMHDCWLAERPLLMRCAQVPRVPTRLIHARDDRVCPPEGALALQAALPGSTLHWLPSGGHDAAHPQVSQATAAAAGALLEALR